MMRILCLNPLKRVNSILTQLRMQYLSASIKSQSPQTGQFNSYIQTGHKSIASLASQSPQTGQFNSYEEK